MKNDTVRYLIGQYMNDALTAEQQQELLQLLGKQNEDELITVLLEMMEADAADALAADTAIMQASLEKILAANKTAEPVIEGHVPVRKPRWRIVAATSCIAVLVIAGYWLFSKKTAVPVSKPATAYTHDVEPGGNKAILTLANGQQIVLDSAGNGRLAQEGSAAISKNGASVKYEAANDKTAITYNKLSTPRGGQYQLVLPDGSKVWLNAASSIRFPTAFVGKERRVEITGEAYFEIKKNSEQPFRVQLPGNAGGGEVEVLGTHFNVNTYEDEVEAKTTLLEGKVRLNQNASSIILAPGEQAQWKANSAAKVVKDIDTETTVAWTNGMFVFRDQRIEHIMKQLSRWYNVAVVYEGKAVTEGFNATIPRQVPVSKVLKLLELTTLVHFKIEGNKITVAP